MRVIAALCVFLLLPAGLFALGSTEEETTGPRTLTLYMLAKGPGEAEAFAIERMELPAAMSLFIWTKYHLVGNQIAMEADASVYGSNRRKVSGISVGALTLLEYRVDLPAVPGSTENPRTTITVSFTAADCMARDGSVLYQPERLAMKLAVAYSGSSSGWARIAHIEHLGEGSFSAAVELR